MPPSLISAESLSRLRSQHLSIALHIKRLSSTQIQNRLRPDKWSIKEHLAHLGRYQEIFEQRIARIINEVNPHLSRYRSEEDKGFEKWTEKSVQQIQVELKYKRDEIIALIQALPHSSISKKAKHTSLGWLDIADWVEFFLLHEAHHLYSIFKISKIILDKPQDLT